MMEDLIKRYDELYEDMATAKDKSKMITFGEADRWIFHEMTKMHPDIAERWLTKLEAGKWNNYLSKEEAEIITSEFINQDGTRGPYWNYDTVKNAVESMGGKMSDEPYYNCWALWVVMNMHYSDHFNSASEFVPRDKMPRYFYKMAVETLKDVDRPKFVRDYFKV